MMLAHLLTQRRVSMPCWTVCHDRPERTYMTRAGFTLMPRSGGWLAMQAVGGTGVTGVGHRASPWYAGP
jgi:hypothetical protein